MIKDVALNMLITHLKDIFLHGNGYHLYHLLYLQINSTIWGCPMLLTRVDPIYIVILLAIEMKGGCRLRVHSHPTVPAVISSNCGLSLGVLCIHQWKVPNQDTKSDDF